MSLLERYEESENKDVTAILQAVRQGDGDVFDKLAENEIHTPLTKAIVLGLHEVVQNMIIKGANPNRKDRLGYTPLYLAVGYSTPKVVEALAAAGADPNDFGSFDETPIYLAIKKDDISYVEILLKAGADPRLSIDGKHPSAYDKLKESGSATKHMLGLME